MTTAAAALALTAALAACDRDSASPSPPPVERNIPELPVLGHGSVPERYTAEVWVAGSFAYTTTWGSRNAPGNAVKIWDVRGAAPVLVDSLIVTDATTLGDVQVSDDGALLVVATERVPGSIVIYGLQDPRRPAVIARFSSEDTRPGVHTATLARVAGRLYAFLAIDPTNEIPARLVVVDLADPAQPQQVLARVMGNPIVHDVFVRDGLLFTALWHDGAGIWDIGGGGRGGSPANPVLLATGRTVGGSVHNLWWLHDAATGSRRWLLVGQEGPGSVLARRSSGDIHVLDIADLTAPREVAFFHVEGAGTHNFSVDEASGVLYAAYYNAGVRAIDVRGDLGACDDTARARDGRCDLARTPRVLARGLVTSAESVFVWGVHHVGTRLFASDMLDGLWVLDASTLRR